MLMIKVHNAHLFLLLIIAIAEANSAVESCAHLQGLAKSNCQGQEYAKSLQARTENASKSPPVNVPHFQGTALPEVNLYQQGINIENIAKNQTTGKVPAEIILQQEQNKINTTRKLAIPQPPINPYPDEGEMICSDGSCARNLHNTDRSGKDFTKAIAHVQAASEILTKVKQDPKALVLFSGKVHKCKVNVLPGFKNCCEGGEGWGVKLGISKCSGDEKELAWQKQAQKVIYIGNYRSGNFIDRRVYHTFCSYPTKLARIIVYQAKAQLQKGFGNSKHPDCSGVTTTELESIDFAKIDLTEIYQDASLNLNKLPSIDQMIMRYKWRTEHKMEPQ